MGGGGGGEAECDNEFLKARRNLGAGRQRKKRADYSWMSFCKLPCQAVLLSD